MKKKLISIIILLILGVNSYSEEFKIGLEVFIEKESLNYKDKKIGVVTNATGVTSKGVQNVDEMLKNGLKVVKLFGPEHGIRGTIVAGKKVNDMIDEKTGLTVYSLYGNTRRPTKEMLNGLDVIVYDIQDIGVRSYTFISTLAYVMQEAAKYGVEVVVLDRPIAMYGNLVDGNILETGFSSFIGLYPIAYVYGMTPGETATFFNSEFGINCKLKVIKMEGYNHEMTYKDTGLKWIAPSPNIPKYESAYYCAATGIFGELGTLSGGAGYNMPFEILGDEGIDGGKIADWLNNKNLEGVKFNKMEFTPKLGKFKDKKCSGIKIEITDERKIKPFIIEIYLFEAFNTLYPEKKYIGNIKDIGNKSLFEKAIGTSKIREMLLNGKSSEYVIASYDKDLEIFKSLREKYLLY
jgi:uncharacterized protein YbbC (DUF1343 family)